MDNLKRYLFFYKPFGVVSSFTDPDGHATLKAYIDVPDVYPAGRLDLDSEGLLFLSNDGPLMHALTDPRFEHTKTYFVQVEGEMTPAAVASLIAGVQVKGVMTRRCQALVIPEPDLAARSKPVTPHGPTTWLRIVLKEGKKRQIRHMTAAVGFPTLRIVRVAIGPVGIGNLQPGEWRELTPQEVARLRERPKSNAGRTPGGSQGNARGSQYRNDAHRSPGPGSRRSGGGDPRPK
jgi:23S rRNA pseudouridine2457 synthase